MLSKKEVKDIQSLRHKKFREERGLFTAEGPKIVSELAKLVSGNMQKIYATQGWLAQNATLLQGVHAEPVTEIELGKISQLQTPNEVLAVLQMFETKEPVVAGSFCLYLDAIQDPGNFGTITRIADWFGVKDIVCGEGCADVYNIKVVQATMASIARVNVFYDKDHKWLARQDVAKFAAALEGESLYKYSRQKEGILIIGNESKGIRPEIMQVTTQKITIPKIGAAESLNAAVATGIILSHLLKRD